MSTAAKHQLRIARKTYHSPGLELLGGMTYTQALDILRQHKVKVSERKIVDDTNWLNNLGKSNEV
mgnify:CR=1 FL=1